MRTHCGLILFSIFILLGCENSQEVKVVFTNIEGLKMKSPVYIDSMVVGKISDINTQSDGSAIITLDIDSEIEIPISSTIQYEVDFLGNSYIEFTTLDKASKFERPQEDSLNSRNLSRDEIDSILKSNPDKEIIDTVLSIIESINSRKQNIDALDRTGTLLTE